MNRVSNLIKTLDTSKRTLSSNYFLSRFSQPPYFLCSKQQTYHKNIFKSPISFSFTSMKRNTYDPNPQKHCLSNTVFMVKPVDFCFNQQTAADNEFMMADKTYSQAKLVQIVIKEFESSVQKLRNLGVNVIVFDKSKYQELKNIKMPDAVFPNNWFNTIDDRIIMFRMRATSRTYQKLQLPWVLEMLNEDGISYNSVENWSESVVQSTGALIFDRKNKRVFAARSQRCEGDLQKLGKFMGYQMVQFTAKSSRGIQFYHTNIVLSIGEQYAVVSSYSLGQDGQRVVEILKKDRTVIEIDPKQTQQHFCGNIMQVQGKDSKVLIVSKTAWNGFTKEQQEFFCKNNKIAMFQIDTIEKIGGGSARCMVAQIFLNQK